MLTTTTATPRSAAADKVTPRHCERRAYVYVRQSTPKQVKQHLEGQRNQYALVHRAVALGWVPERIRVIDADQGQSGQDGERAGFQELVAEVSLGHVGLILAYEASRLARNNAAWYTLLDLAALRGSLIADPDGLYDPRDYNDRLLLGLSNPETDSTACCTSRRGAHRDRGDAPALRSVGAGMACVLARRGTVGAGALPQRYAAGASLGGDGPPAPRC